MLRTVIRTEEFERDSVLVEPCLSRWDDILSGVEWVLANDPSEGTHLGPPDGRAWKIGLAWVPKGYSGVDVYYAFDAQYVYLLGVRLRTPID